MPEISDLAVPALLAAAAAASAAPAAASPDLHRHLTAHDPVHYAGFGESASLHRDIGRLEKTISHDLARHRISAREAKTLRRDVDRLDRMLAEFRRGGLKRDEARLIESGIAELERSLHASRRG